MIISSNGDLLALKKIGKIVAEIRDKMIESIKPGMTTGELDEIAGRMLDKYGAKSAPVSQYNFPGYTCISVNDVAAHGIPGDLVIMEGDLVNVDVSAELDGYFADTGATKLVEPGLTIKGKLLNCSKNALYKAINIVRDGVLINEIGREIEAEAKSQGFNIIRNLTGHGIGKKLHENPKHIYNYYAPRHKEVLTKGLVLAVETFISTGAEYVKTQDDGWTLKTLDGSYVAQFEHTIVVTEDEPIILTE